MIDKVEDSYLFKRYVINRYASFAWLFNEAGLSYKDSTANVYCPFHGNFSTPSAKIYKNEDGDRLFCFSERKLYRPYDMFKLDLLTIKPDALFQNIWRSIKEADKEDLKQNFDKPLDILPLCWKENQNKLHEFSKGKVSIGEHFKILLDSLE